MSKPCTQVYLQIFANCINWQLAIRISKNHAFRTCTTPSRTFRPILSSIGLLDNEIPQKEIISTDGRTDRQTDGQTSRTTTIGSFFEKRKNYKKGIFLQYFLYKILAKYSPKRTKLQHLKKILHEPSLHGASRHANTPTFPKIF